ncbi:MAG: transglycosylase SLT domain-containing protein [Rhodospirillaceae bacterium]|nr:transglycosylase SLT domain-containing protein [Rhodospirillaceae bacterium]
MPHPVTFSAKPITKALSLAVFLWLANGIQAFAWSGVCLDTTQRVGAAEGLPRHMLSSIAITESGRTDPKTKAKVAWPWTVTSGGAGQYFPTKAAAIAEVKRLQRAGVRNIDVGCMQINLKYHPDAFASLAEAFDPETNVRYASRFLKDLKQAWNSWSEAIQHYHSADATRGRAYEKRVVLNHQDLTSSLAHAPTPVQKGKTFATPERTRVAPRSLRVANNDVTQQRRNAARAEAEAWRQRKLDEYLAHRAALRDG